MTGRLDWATDGRDWPNRQHSKFVSVGRVRWHVQQLGKGPCLLLLHGTGSATHSWRDLAPMLADHFQVIAPDLPGHGFTTGRPSGGLSMPAIASAVGELLAALDARPALVVGHSAGAAIAARMTIDRHIRPQAIVGLDAALLPFPGLGAKLFPTLAKLMFLNPLAPRLFVRMAEGRGETARFLVRSTGSRIDAKGVELYERLFRSTGHVSGALTMMAEWDLQRFAADLPKLGVPLRLVHGEQDRAILIDTARYAAAMVEDGKLIPLPALGHLAHEEQPDVVAAHIRQFAGVN